MQLLPPWPSLVNAVTFGDAAVMLHVFSQAKQVKLDRSVDFRRRLAAAAREAREEIESSALRRRLLPPRRECSNENVRGGKGFHDDGDLTQEVSQAL